MRRTLTLSTALAAVAVAAALHVTPASAASYDPLVYRAQMALSAKGFDTGTPDGKLGPRTRAAVEAYQKASGIQATGTVSQNLVAQLEGGASVTPPRRADRDVRAADRRAPRMTQTELIHQTQTELNRHGYNLTFEGGRLNGETSDAIRDYQARHGLEPTGMLFRNSRFKKLRSCSRRPAVWRARTNCCWLKSSLTISRIWPADFNPR